MLTLSNLVKDLSISETAPLSLDPHVDPRVEWEKQAELAIDSLISLQYRPFTKKEPLETTQAELLKIFSQGQEILKKAGHLLQNDSKKDYCSLIPTTKKIFDAVLSTECGLKSLCTLYLREEKSIQALMPTILKIYGLQTHCRALEAQIRRISASAFDTIDDGDKKQLPFPNPLATDEQRVFNISFSSTITTALHYVQQERNSLVSKVGKVYKMADTGIQWPISVTPTGNIYFHYGITIHGSGNPGQFKTAKSGYSVATGQTIAKLTSTIRSYSKKRATQYRVAQREEQFLLLCKEKQLPHIVQTYEIFWFTKKTKLGKEVKRQTIYQHFYSHGSLYEAKARLLNDPTKVKEILKGILQGVAALHEHKIVHGDLKDKNVYLDSNDTPFIGDFGFAGFEDTPCEGERSPTYADPGLLEGTQKKCYHDIWSLGFIWYLYLFNVERVPWQATATTLRELTFFTDKKRPYLFPEPQKTDQFEHLCWRMLQLDSAKRPTAQEALKQLEY